MSQKEYFGFGSINNLKKIIDNTDAKSFFLVTGKTSYKCSGAESVLNQLLESYRVERFNDFEINPRIEDIKEGIKLFNKNSYDIVIGIGGGTVIDMAKLINIFSVQKGNVVDYIKKSKQIRNRGKPLITIPTTAGTGSEATNFAVVYINKKKYSVEHEFLLPDYSIVDPNFTIDLSPYITATTGMDALSQAIESYWCIHSTEESKNYAKKSIKLIMNNLMGAVNQPSKKSRNAMAKAANLAGKAINITKTTAPHAISYPITSYFGVPHGHAVALTLPEFIQYNGRVNEKTSLDIRGINYVKKAMKEIYCLLGANNPEGAKESVTKLMHNIGLETKLSELGIYGQEIKLIVDNGFNPERIKNNPRKVSAEELFSILSSIK